jgi:hypothetical protein
VVSADADPTTGGSVISLPSGGLKPGLLDTMDNSAPVPRCATDVDGVLPA